MLGVFWAKWEKRHKKWSLMSLLVFSIFLEVSVGPSTSNLMRPHLSDWPAGGTTFWVNATSNLLSPRIVDASQSLAHCQEDTGDRACPQGGWEAINQNYLAYWPSLQPLGNMPETLNVPDPFSAREMLPRQCSTTYRNTDVVRTSSI